MTWGLALEFSPTP